MVRALDRRHTQREGDRAMTTATELPVTEQIDTALDEIQQARAVAIALPGSVERCLQLAELADVEAAWWEELSERSRTRIYWRAALAAREYAQHTARHWRDRATAQRTSAAVPQAETEAR